MEKKIQLHKECLSRIEKSIQSAQKALDAAIKAGNEETKSSAGDKYETGRAMMQMEQDKNREVLIKAVLLKTKLSQIDPLKSCSQVETGALLLTNNGNYYISSSIGKILLDGTTYYAISPEAPFAKALWLKKVQEQVTFNNRQFTIHSIY